jgi:peroxiredoxin
MKKALFGLSIAATLGVWIADTLLLGIPAIRNGWWSLLFFIVPLALIVLGWSPDKKGRLGAAAVAAFILGLGGYVATRTLTGRVSGTPAVAVGQSAPDFELKDQDGKDVELSDFTKLGRVVLVFFRSAGCFICRGQLGELAGRFKDFETSRVTVVAVGKVTPDEAKSLALPFPVLSDVDLVAVKKYGLLHEKGYLFQDVGRPTTILVGQDGVIRWISAADTIRPRPSVDEIFEQLRK